jgi:hypothetical protein
MMIGDMIHPRNMMRGDVLRLPGESAETLMPFPDHVVSRFETNDKGERIMVILSRPHCQMNGGQITIGIEEVPVEMTRKPEYLLIRRPTGL